MAEATQFYEQDFDEQFAPGNTVADGRYRILMSCGEDRFGRIFLAWDIRRESAVSLKLLKREVSSSQPLVRWLRQQWTDLQDLHHPNLLRIIELHQLVGHCLLIEEWVEGDTLLGLLQTRGSLPLREAIPLLGQMGSVLDFARDQRFASGNLDLTRVAIHFPDEAGKADWRVPFLESMDTWPMWQAKFHPLAQESRRHAGDLSVFFCATVYRILGGNPSAGSRARYVPLPGLSEEGNFALKQFLAEAKKAESCCALLQKLCETENLAIPDSFQDVEGHLSECLTAVSIERLRAENERWERHLEEAETERKRLEDEQRRWEAERQQVETVAPSPETVVQVETEPDENVVPAAFVEVPALAENEPIESIGSIDDLTGDFDPAESPINEDTPPIVSIRPRQNRRKRRSRKLVTIAVGGLLLAGTTGGYTWMTQLPDDPAEIQAMGDWRQSLLFEKCEAEMKQLESQKALRPLLERVDYYQAGFNGERSTALLDRAAAAFEHVLALSSDVEQPLEEEIVRSMPGWKQEWFRESLQTLVRDALARIGLDSDQQVLHQLTSFMALHSASGGDDTAWQDVADEALQRIEDQFRAQEDPSLPPHIGDLMTRLGASADPLILEAQAYAALGDGELTTALDACLTLLNLEPEASTWFPHRATLVNQFVSAFVTALRDWELSQPEESQVQGLKHFLTTLAGNNAEAAAVVGILNAREDVARGEVDAALARLNQLETTLSPDSPLRSLAFDKTEVLLGFLRTAQTAVIRVRVARPTDVALMSRAAEAVEAMGGHNTENRALFLAWMDSDFAQGQLSEWFDRAVEWADQPNEAAVYWSALRRMLEGVRTENAELLRDGATRMEELIALAPLKRGLDTSRLLAKFYGVPKNTDSRPKGPAEQRRLEYLKEEGLTVPEEIIDELNRTAAIDLGIVTDEKEGLQKALAIIEGALVREPSDFNTLNDALYYHYQLSQLASMGQTEKAAVYEEMETLALNVVERGHYDLGFTYLHVLGAQLNHRLSDNSLEQVRAAFDSPPEDRVKRGEVLYWQGMWYSAGLRPYSRNATRARALLRQAAALGNAKAQ